MAFLFQHAVWTTLQFWRLRIAVMIASSFLEHVLHSTLPPVAMAAIAHTFKEYCGGGGEGSSDFAALVAPYVFDFYLLMGCGWSSRRPRSLAPGERRVGSLGVGVKIALLSSSIDASTISQIPICSCELFYFFWVLDSERLIAPN